MRDNQTVKGLWWPMTLLILIILSVLYFSGDLQSSWCKLKIIGHPDLYCKDIQTSNDYLFAGYADFYKEYRHTEYGNIEVTDCYNGLAYYYEESTYLHHYKVRNSTEEARIKNENNKKADACVQERIEALKCLKEGHDINQTYDIQIDYDLNCKQLGYINDHLVDNVQQKDGGYIRGNSWGFLSGGHLEGEFHEYVVTRILATGQLVKQVTQRVNCKGEKQTPNIEMYSEADFVMYYVDKCIGKEVKNVG